MAKIHNIKNVFPIFLFESHIKSKDAQIQIPKAERDPPQTKVCNVKKINRRNRKARNFRPLLHRIFIQYANPTSSTKPHWMIGKT